MSLEPLTPQQMIDLHAKEQEFAERLRTHQPGTCQACRFWKGSETDNWSGECRRRAPVVLGDTNTKTTGEQGEYRQEIETTMVSRWPRTSRKDWCGDGVAYDGRIFLGQWPESAPPQPAFPAPVMSQAEYEAALAKVITKTSSPGIKVCPTCGAGAQVVMLPNFLGPGHYLRCEKCDARTASYDSRDRAIEMWNAGAIDTPKP